MKIITEITLVLLAVLTLIWSSVAYQVKPTPDKVEVIQPVRYVLPDAEEITRDLETLAF